MKEPAIITKAKAYINKDKERKEFGITSREIKEYLKEQGIECTLTSQEIGWIFKNSLNFRKELKYSPRYKQELNHWILK